MSRGEVEKDYMLQRIVLMGIMAASFMSPILAAERAAEPASTMSESKSAPGTNPETKPLLPFVEVQTAKISTRYNFVANDQEVTTKNHQQHKEAFGFRFRFDREGKYSLNMAAGSGSGFTSSWDSLGIGSDGSSNLNFREFYLSLKPGKELTLQYGGIAMVRGVGTEITTYDNDAYLMGARVSIKSPQRFFFDEITGTLAHVSDLNEPDVFRRFDRLNEANYHQVLVTKKIGKRATIGGEYASLSGIATLRQAILVKVPEAVIIDAVRFENYQRVEGRKDYGFAIQADKRVHKTLALSGGFADIDRHYGGLNGDRFNKGKRLFALAKIDILKSLDAEVFIQQAVANSYSISNDIRLDLVLTYDLLPGIRKLGVFRTPQ